MVRTLVLVKHALPVLEAGKPAREWCLGAEGERQARRLAHPLQEFLPLRLVTSPEPKAARTGALVGAELGLVAAVADGLGELDRRPLPVLAPAAYERALARTFADPDRRILGMESGREASERFSAALARELARTEGGSLVVVAHGVVISLFVSAHNPVEPFGLWRRLPCGAFVVLDVPSFALREVRADAV